MNRSASALLSAAILALSSCASTPGTRLSSGDNSHARDSMSRLGSFIDTELAGGNLAAPTGLEYVSLRDAFRQSHASECFPAEAASLRQKVTRYESLVTELKACCEQRDTEFAALKDWNAAYERSQIAACRLLPVVRAGDIEVALKDVRYVFDYADPAGQDDPPLAFEHRALVALNSRRDLTRPGLSITEHADQLEVTVEVRNHSTSWAVRPEYAAFSITSARSADGFAVVKQANTHRITFTDDTGKSYLPRLGPWQIQDWQPIQHGAALQILFPFRLDNRPEDTAKTFTITFDKAVFGKEVNLAVPMTLLRVPALPQAH